MNLRVMEIERFAIHDGPGIRTVVFLHGCPLHCPWCSNPESQSTEKQLMYSSRRCIRCQNCARNCPKNNISFDGDKMIFCRKDCGECEICGEVCPSKAITFSGRRISTDEILKEVMKDKDYYDDSHGGITISGGEPFTQYHGFLELLKESKKRNLHVAVETTGNVEIEKIMEAEPYIDLFLFDIKHVDAKKLGEVTGGDLHKILKSLNYIVSRNPQKVIVRVPVIPSFNYDDTTIESIMDLACENHVTEVHLLPYHTLGKNKYDKLGIEYRMGEVKMLSKKELKKYIDIGKEKSLKIIVGG